MVSNINLLHQLLWLIFFSLFLKNVIYLLYLQDFIIVDVLPISIVEKPGFKKLVSNLAPTLILHGRTFFTNKLKKEYKERRQHLIDALRKYTDAATTIDAWTFRQRSYLGETKHWFDSVSLKRKSACLAIRRIK